MTYQVLARKWRPKTFADLVGQEHVVQALRNALAEGRLHHAYLLTGTRGVGKTTIARILAKSLNCESAQAGEPCGVCPSCTAIDQGRFVDVLEIDAASNTGIDNIREVLENAQYAPTAGRYKVYIIDEVHMLSKPAFNAMLKTLEEPPEHVKFILATTDPHKVPVTVLSRCLQFVLRNMTTPQVAAHLSRVLDAEGAGYESGALTLIGRAAAGSMRDALSLLDQAIALGQGSVAETDVRHMIGAVDKSYLYGVLRALVAGDGAALMAEAERMAAAATGFDHALNELALLLQQLALWKRVPSAFPADDPEWRELSALADTLGEEEIQLYYQCAVHGRRDLPLAPDEYAGFVMTLLRMLAFAPLAAAAHPADAQIGGTELTDPQIKQTSAATKETARPPETPKTPQAAVADQAAEPPPADTADSRTNGGKKNRPKANPSADKPDTAAGLPVGTLPPLTAENWVDIAETLMNSSDRSKATAFLTGLNRLAFCAWDENSGQLTLAVEPTAAALKKRHAIKDLSEQLGQAYGRPLHIVLADWSEAAPADTVELRRLRRLSEQNDNIRATLEADQTARDLLQQFDGQWLPESLRETDGSGQNP